MLPFGGILKQKMLPFGGTDGGFSQNLNGGKCDGTVGENRRYY